MSVEEQEDKGVSTGALGMPAEPDTTIQSMAAAVLDDIKSDPPKRKPGRPKKVKEPEPDDDITPPTAPISDVVDAEPESQADDTDDVEEPDDDASLDKELKSLAEDLGVDPQFFEGAESVAEAQRLFQKMTGFYYSSGFAAQQQPEPEPEPPQRKSPKPAAKVQKQDDDVEDELDFSELEDDEVLKKQFDKIKRDRQQIKQELAEIKAWKDQLREQEFVREQQRLARELQQEFFRASGDLFGAPDKQDVRQQARMQQAFNIADWMVRGAASSNTPLPSIRGIAQMAIRAGFADELANQKIAAQRESVQKRQQRRSVGAPAKNGRGLGLGTNGNGKVYEGPLSEDPDILNTVRGVLSRIRD